MYVTSQQQPQEIVQISFFFVFTKAFGGFQNQLLKGLNLLIFSIKTFLYFFLTTASLCQYLKLNYFSDILSFSFYSCYKDFRFIFFSLLLFTLRCSQWYREHRKGWEKGWERLPALTVAATLFKLASFTCFTEFFLDK